ncbi:MAG TPA: Crp/Fnr family transcriptional regulator [Candidatus Dormibacteraeota bacterium]|nr:Crp/Fnr family transcriptional regulator [Candidatus Dormibacteraeota bacterium]
MPKQSGPAVLAARRSAPSLGFHPIPKLNVAAQASPVRPIVPQQYAPELWTSSRGLGCEVLHARGSLIFTEGQAASGVYLVEKGSVKLTMCSGRGRSLILGFFGPQAVLGLAAAILGETHEATAEAAHPSATRFCSREDLLRNLRQPGDAGLRAAQLLSQTVYSTLRDMESFWLTGSVEQKLARFLLSLCSARKGSREPMYIPLGLTHEDISQRLGVSRETVTRLLSRLKKQSILDLKQSMLTILNPLALRCLADPQDDPRTPAKLPGAKRRISSDWARAAEMGPSH